MRRRKYDYIHREVADTYRDTYKCQVENPAYIKVVIFEYFLDTHNIPEIVMHDDIVGIYLFTGQEFTSIVRTHSKHEW